MSDEEGDALSVMLGNGISGKKKTLDVRSVNRKYGDEWNELCDLAEKGLPHLQRHVLQMHLQGSRLRSIYWQLLLRSLPSAPSLWVPKLRQQRSLYRLIRQRLTVDPHQANKDDDPLSQSSSSSWHQYFCDKELRALIHQDVVRTFPNTDFFRSESIQCIMVHILFCYAREHPEMCYRQGMHEVLAPLIFVMQSDHQSVLQAQELASVSSQAMEILDPTCLEEDSYWLFSKVMSQLAGSYRVRNLTPLLTGHFPSSLGLPGKDPSLGVLESELATRLKFIKDELLARFDEELHRHLVSLEIPFQTFGIRWLRVLFGQEFPLLDLLCLWDAIFADGDNFELVNYIVVSMLSIIRDQLIVEDDTECLMLLMRYPSGIDVRTIVESALQMRRPMNYPDPKDTKSKKEKLEAPLLKKKGKTQSNTMSGRFKKLSLWSQKKDSQMVPHISKSPTTSLNLTSVSKPAHLETLEKNQNVVEGYTLNDPVVTRAELRHLYNLISHVHSHLSRHSSTLERTLPQNTPNTAWEALAGIEELCVQLYHALPPVPKVIEVETASEAEPVPRTGLTSTKSATNTSSNESSTNKLNKDCQLMDMKSGYTQEVSSYFPMNKPLRALCLRSSERDVSLHANFCRVLGSCMI